MGRLRNFSVYSIGLAVVWAIVLTFVFTIRGMVAAQQPDSHHDDAGGKRVAPGRRPRWTAGLATVAGSPPVSDHAAALGGLSWPRCRGRQRKGDAMASGPGTPK
jgi:hypothetical protein